MQKYPAETLGVRWAEVKKYGALYYDNTFAPAAAAPYAGVTRWMNVFPTMAGLSNIELPEDRGIQGVDLSEALTGVLPALDLRAYSHTTVLIKSVFRQMYRKLYERNWLEAGQSTEPAIDDSLSDQLEDELLRDLATSSNRGEGGA